MGFCVEKRDGSTDVESRRMSWVEVETPTKESFPVSTSDSEPRLATRSESILVDDFRQWLTANGLESSSALYYVHDSTLRSDLFIRDWNLLVEAKANSNRGSIRTAIGQLFDYRRFHNPEPKIAILVPREPERDLLELLHGLEIEVWFRDGDRFVSS